MEHLLEDVDRRSKGTGGRQHSAEDQRCAGETAGCSPGEEERQRNDQQAKVRKDRRCIAHVQREGQRSGRLRHKRPNDTERDGDRKERDNGELERDENGRTRGLGIGSHGS